LTFAVAAAICVAVNLTALFIILADWPVPGAPDVLVKDALPPTMISRVASHSLQTILLLYMKIMAPFAKIARLLAPSNGFMTLFVGSVLMALVVTVVYCFVSML
jgi:hypothetical protein